MILRHEKKTRLIVRRNKDPLDERTIRCSYPSLPYTDPFSLIVKVKSPRVWDVICSTLVLYRSTPGLDRGVGVFKGDYTQRQGWLYWRSLPVALIRHDHAFSFQFFPFLSSICLPTIYLYTPQLYQIFHTFAKVHGLKIEKLGKEKTLERVDDA